MSVFTLEEEFDPGLSMSVPLEELVFFAEDEDRFTELLEDDVVLLDEEAATLEEETFWLEDETALLEEDAFVLEELPASGETRFPRVLKVT